MIDFSVLDDATIWVAISFILFVILIFKPIKSQISDSLDKKIIDLKIKIDEAQKLKNEAEKLYQDHQDNLKISLQKIEQLKLDTKNEIQRITTNVNDELNIITSRKKKTFENNSKQTEEKIKDELKKEILEKTIFFTEHRIKKELKKTHNSKFIEESLKKSCQKVFPSLWLYILSYQKLK